MSLTKNEELLLKALYATEAGILIAQILGMEAMISPLFYITFLMVPLLYISVLKRKFIMQDVLCLGIIFIAFFNVIFDSLITDGPFSLAYLKKVIMFSMTILFFQIGAKVKISFNCQKFIINVVKALSLLFVIMYFMDTFRMYIFNGRVTKYLTFTFTNPNLTALFLVCFELLIIIEFIVEKNKFIKLFNGGLSIIMAYFIVETQSRNGMLVLCLFVAFLILNLRKNIRFQFNRLVSFIFASWPLLFSVAYMFIMSSEKIMSFIGIFGSEGKEVDSRFNIWYRAYELFIHAPFKGAYNHMSDGTGLSQMHNTHIDIAVSYGIIVLIMVIILLFNIFYKNRNKMANRNSFLSMFSFAFTLVMGMAEAAVFSGGLGIYIFSAMFLFMSLGEDPDTLQKNEA